MLSKKGGKVCEVKGRKGIKMQNLIILQYVIINNDYLTKLTSQH